ISLFQSFIKHGGKKVIAAGTCAEYPQSSKPIEEEALLSRKLTPYGEAKRRVHDYLAKLVNEHNIQYTWPRIFGLYGPFEKEARIIPSMIKAIEDNKTFTINEPHTFCDYVYIDDFADFIVKSITLEGMGPVNIGTGQSISLR